MNPTRPARHILAATALSGLLALTACTDTGATTTDTLATAETGPAVDTQWNERLIEGPDKPEDLIRLTSGTIMISGMSADPGSEGAAGSLYAMDADSGDLTKVWPHPEVAVVPDTVRFGDCPGEPDVTVASPHGLGSHLAEDGTEYLYVVNHGGRESVEVFEVGDALGPAGLTWVGCSVLPEGSFGNGVAADPDTGGFYVTHFLNPADMLGQFEQAFAGESTGEVLHWSPEAGWAAVPDSRMSTPNGIAVSGDGDSLYVASWGGRELVELDAATGERRNAVELAFLPDNLRYTADGRILVTGQVIDDFETFVQYESGERAPEDRYDVYALDPETFTLELVARGDIAGFGNPTTALEVDDRILVGSVAGDRILELQR